MSTNENNPIPITLVGWDTPDADADGAQSITHDIAVDVEKSVANNQQVAVIGSRVHPLGDKVLLRQIPKEDEVTPSGLFLPTHLVDDQSKLVHRAEVIAVGRGRALRPVPSPCVGEDVQVPIAPMSVRVGDVVLVAPYTGVNVPMATDPDGSYIVISDADILAVVDRPADR